MTPLQQAANDLAKAYWLLNKAGFIRGFDEDESLQECEHLQGIANEAMKSIKRLLEIGSPSPGRE